MTANVSLKLPVRFDFKLPNEWQNDSAHYYTAFGKESDNVHTSTNTFKHDQKNYNAMLGKFDSFFNVRRNVIYMCSDLIAETKSKEKVQNNTSLVSTAWLKLVSVVFSRKRCSKIELSYRLRAGNATETPNGCGAVLREGAICQKEAVHEQQQQLQGDGSAKEPIGVDEMWCTWRQGQRPRVV